MCAAKARHDTFFISHVCKPACTCKIGDVKTTVPNSRVHTRYVHNARVHVRNAHTKFGLRMHANCKIITYKEANQLQSSCISLPTATVPVVTPHV